MMESHFTVCVSLQANATAVKQHTFKNMSDSNVNITKPTTFDLCLNNFLAQEFLDNSPFSLAPRSHFLRDSSMKFSTSGFFQKSVIPGPLIYILRYFCHLLIFR